MQSSSSTLVSTRCGRPTGYGKTEHSESSVLSTTRPSEPLSVRQMASRPSIGRARSLLFAATAVFNMLMCEFLTAMHHKLPVKAVIYNNSAFGLIPLEAEIEGLPSFREAIEFPNPDFVALARACGGHGFKVTKPSELRTAIREAFAVDGPAIVDAIVVADELPNL